MTNDTKNSNIQTSNTKTNITKTSNRGEKMRIDRIKLVAELARRDMTQGKLAELAGVSRATVNYIKGGTSCSDEVGNKIAGALNMPVEELIEK